MLWMTSVGEDDAAVPGLGLDLARGLEGLLELGAEPYAGADASERNCGGYAGHRDHDAEAAGGLHR